MAKSIPGGTLTPRGEATEQWLHNEVVPAYKALKADPTSGSSLEEVRTALEARHTRMVKTARR